MNFLEKDLEEVPFSMSHNLKIQWYTSKVKGSEFAAAQRKCFCMQMKKNMGIPC